MLSVLPAVPASPALPCLGSPTSFLHCVTNPVGTVAGAVGGAVGSVVNSVWTSIASDFAAGATQMLGAFADFFAHSTSIDLAGSGYGATFELCTSVAASLAVVVLCLQVAMSVKRRDGNGIGRALVGSAEAFVVLGSIVGVTTALLVAADKLTDQITNNAATYAGLQHRLTQMFSAGAADPTFSAALLIVFGLVGIVLSLILYVEMLARQAAIVVLVATSPIPVAGLMGDETRRWFRGTATQLVMLIFLKPVIALILQLGLSAASTSSTINGLLAGSMVLLCAAIAWPVLARLLSFTSAGGGAHGLASSALAGAAGGLSTAGRHVSGPSGSRSVSADLGGAQDGAGGSTGGGVAAQQRLSVAGLSGGGSGGGIGGGAAAGGGGAAARGGGAAGAAGALGLGLTLAAKAVRSGVGLVDRMAEHGGAGGQLTHGSPYASSPSVGGFMSARHAGAGSAAGSGSASPPTQAAPPSFEQAAPPPPPPAAEPSPFETQGQP